MTKLKYNFFSFLEEHFILKFLFNYIVWPLWDFVVYVLSSPFTLLKMIPFFGGRGAKSFYKFANSKFGDVLFLQLFFDD